jgi:leucyl/phenylalanyl-tRNA---protein transferase
VNRITPDILLQAYRVGVFPMAESAISPGLHWIDPPERGILPLDAFHVSRSLAQSIRHKVFDVRINSAFAQVIASCAAATPDRPDTWINDRILRLYTGLFQLGHAHSVECWKDGELVGGLYGVHIGAAFFGESMFSRKTDASKVALVYLVARLKAGGFRLLDTQFLTAHLARFGTVAVPKSRYLWMLEGAVSTQGDFMKLDIATDVETVLEIARGINQSSGVSG